MFIASVYKYVEITRVKKNYLELSKEHYNETYLFFSNRNNTLI